MCLDNLLTGSSSNISQLLTDRAFQFVRTDVTEELPVRLPVDVVLHLASPASPRDYVAHPVETLTAGSLGTHQALRLAHEAGARFLFASTSEIYGDPLVHPQSESYWGNVNPLGPRAVYDEAKRYAEALTATYRRSYDVDTAIARFFNTYGPRMRAGDGRVIPTFVRQALAGEPLTVTGDGSQTRSICYVEDIIEGVVRLMHSDHPGPVNLGNPHEITVMQLATTILGLTASLSPTQYIPRPPDDPNRRCPDITLARGLLDWQPAVPLVEGLGRTIAWFRRQQTTTEPAQVQAQFDNA